MLRAIPIRPRPPVAGKCAPGKPQALPQALKDKGRGFMTPALLCPYSPECVEEVFCEVQLAHLTDHLACRYTVLRAKELVREQDGRTKLLWSSDLLRKDGRG